MYWLITYRTGEVHRSGYPREISALMAMTAARNAGWQAVGCYLDEDLSHAQALAMLRGVYPPGARERPEGPLLSTLG